MAEDEIYRKFSGLKDDEWIELVIRSVSEPIIAGVEFPGLPEPKLQWAMVGSSGDAALRDAASFYLEIKNYCHKHDLGFGDHTRILDFGCGFGRHYRFFLKDVPSKNLIGTDLDESFIATCKKTIPMGTFQTNEAWPSSIFQNNYFDLIYAYSVFSHLSEELGLAWIKEFTRILRPRGIVMVTTHSRRLIDYCASLRKRTEFDHPWQERAAKHAFLETAQAHADYDEGKFLFAMTGEPGGIRKPELYGMAVISPSYIRRHWLDHFDFIDFVDDRDRIQQAMIVLQKNAHTRRRHS